MAVGRRDYTWGFLNEAATEGRYTESFFKNNTVYIASSSVGTVYDYTVPVGYKLGINQIHFSTDSRCVNMICLYVKNTLSGYIHFSDNYVFSFSDQNPLYLFAGERFFITCYNYDEVTANFRVIVIGVLASL